MDLVIVHLSKTECERNKEPKIDPQKNQGSCKIAFQLNSLSIKPMQNRAIFTNFKTETVFLTLKLTFAKKKKKKAGII